MEQVVAPLRVLADPHFDRWEEALEEAGHRNCSSAYGAITRIPESPMVIASCCSLSGEALARLPSPVHPSVTEFLRQSQESAHD